MKEPIRFKCRKCGSKLRTKTDDAGSSSPCPKCGSEITVPFPGMPRLGYWGCWVGSKFFGGLIGAAGAADGSAIIMLPVFLFLGIIITYFRAINIGIHPAWTFAGLIPGSVLYFGIAPEGYAKKRALTKIDLGNLSGKQKSFLRSHLEGASIEWAAVQNDVKIETAQKIYAEFHAAYSKQPKAEQSTYVVKILG